MKKFLAVLAVVAIVAFAAPAFAANPFMDVPAGHWAYDAVAQLAAKGVVSGYPDGAFKGAQPATRYEMASVVARALAKVDAEKASKQDLEMLKKLVMEFKDELDALGVKVDKIDKRVAVLEDRLGGWKVTGEFRFDANFADENGTYGAADNSDKNFNVSRARLHFYNFIDENTTFYGRLNTMDAKWARFQITTKLPYDIQFRVGRFNVDWEDAHGFYNGDENDATFGDFDVDGFQFEKKFGMVTATAVAGRNMSTLTKANDPIDLDNRTLVALKLHADFNEKFRAGAMGYWTFADDSVMSSDKTSVLYTPFDINTYGVYAGLDFTPAVTLQGLYYWQDVDVDNWDNAKSWKAQLNIKQELLKFTSLWIEYAQEDNNFIGLNMVGDTYNWTGDHSITRPFSNEGTSKIWLVRADQKWNDKWGSFLRYAKFDWDTTGLDDTTNWTVGLKYQYTPAINFQLAYDQIKNVDGGDQDGSVLRFRTYVTF